MSILGNDLLLGSGDEGYNLTRSLRFRSSASATLSRTFGTPTNNKIWTQSFWLKRGSLAATRQTILASTPGGVYWIVEFDASNRLNIYDSNAASPFTLTTTQVFVDPSAWYHIVVAEDTTQATASNRTKVYVNGVQITSFVSANYPPQNSNTWWNAATYSQSIASALPGGGLYFDGYLTEINFIDGQALTPSSFGSTNTLTGVWQPAPYTGTYGTNGFYLPFTDNSALTTSSNVGLGKDFSGNGNYWTTNNISITSGVTYDSMTDVPTLTSATAANFAVLNPLDSGRTLSNGNLTYAGAASGITKATFGVSSGKWYWEFTAGNTECMVGLCAITLAPTTSWIGSSSGGWGYFGTTGLKYVGGSGSSYGASYTTNDIIGVAFDADNGTLAFYKNGTSQGTAFTGITGSTYCPANGNNSTSDSGSLNFGQRPFAYTPPTGFVALNTFNLPTSTIVKGNTVMDATTFTGVTAGATVTNAAGFKPDFVWMKNRSAARNNELLNSVTGGSSTLFSNLTNAEATDQRISSFNSNGFTYTSNSNSANTGESIVGWQWQAGQGTTSSNTSGSITSTVSVNASAGFSVVTYTGTGANATVGHGLGVAPSLIICKSRGASTNWGVWHASLTSYSYFLLLNSTAAQATAANTLQALPTSTLVSLGASSIFNDASTMVMYAWTPIAGYSAFGSLTGNGSADGVFVYTGFQPKFVMMKSTSTGNWVMIDTARNPYNVAQAYLAANSSGAEATGSPVIDTLSNGFKVRTTWTDINPSGTSVIYAAFATSPFKNSLAR